MVGWLIIQLHLKTVENEVPFQRGYGHYQESDHGRIIHKSVVMTLFQACRHCWESDHGRSVHKSASEA
jgi:hypothetical protein